MGPLDVAPILEGKKVGGWGEKTQDLSLGTRLHIQHHLLQTGSSFQKGGKKKIRVDATPNSSWHCFSVLL